MIHRALGALVIVLCVVGCHESAPTDGGPIDAATGDAGLDAALDDAGVDAAVDDAGPDDAGPIACDPACEATCTACEAGSCVTRGAPRDAVLTATGWNQAFAIDAAGKLYAWGANNTGQLGLGDTVDRDLASQVGSDTFVRLASGSRHSCGIRADGALFCWGVNVHGQLGVGDTVDRPSPVRVGDADDWTDVACGGLHTCGIRAGGTLYCWGSNPAGQLGIGDVFGDQPLPVPVGAPGGHARVVAQTRHTCVIRDDGSLWCWGDNSDGQIGVGDQTDRRSPQKILDGVRWVRPGALHTCAIDLAGALYCWGANDHGNLGLGDRVTPRTTPVRVGDASDWIEVAGGFQHTCGIREGGALWCWGDGALGQLGVGTLEEITLPAQVGTELGWSSVSGGIGHTCALHDDGTGSAEVRCWGDASRGQTAAARPELRADPAPACFAP